jgi:formylmethanofuran dehydrogenase subunit E
MKDEIKEFEKKFKRKYKSWNLAHCNMCGRLQICAMFKYKSREEYLCKKCLRKMMEMEKGMK